MGNKIFIERLNSELDEIGLPKENHERIDALSKLLKIQHFKAEALLGGSVRDTISIDKIAKELEVNSNWLIGTSSTRRE